MLFGTRGLRATARITLVCFTWMILYPTLAAASAPAPPAPAGAASGAPNWLEDLRETARRARDKAGKGQAHDREDQELVQSETVLDNEEASAEAGFAEVERHIQDHHLPPEILQRQQQARADYRAKMKALKAKLRAFSEAHDRTDPAQSQSALNDLADFLEKEQKTRSQQPFDPNHLPFGTPDDQVRAPKEKKEDLDQIIHPQNSVKVAATELSPGLLAAADPAPSAAPTPEDLAETEDVQITPAIQAQAEALHNNPVEIYNFVRNRIEFLPTYGSIQGSDLTLQTLRGNAFDTASLLIALLRAAKIPARYVYGTIQVPAEQVMNWVGGVKTPEAAQSLLGQGGIPSIGLVSGGQIMAFKLEQVWVEAFVDYIPSRGAVNRIGDTWVAMDGSFKLYDYSAPLDVSEIAGFDITGDLAHLLRTASVDEANSSVTGVDGDFLLSRLAAYQDKLAVYARTQPNPLTLEQAFGGKTIRKLSLPILAGSLPYSIVTVGNRTAALPDHLRHSVRLEFFASALDRSSGAPTLSQTLSLPRLGSRRLGITYLPATAADAAVLQSLDATDADSIPLYLVQVKPQIKLDDTVVAEDVSLGMGADHTLDIVVSRPDRQRRLSYSRIAGDEIVVSVDATGLGFEQVTRRFQTTPADTAAENLHQLGLHYWAESDLFNRLNQPVYGVTTVRLPSVGVFSSPLSVIYSFGISRIGYYLKRNIDIKLSQYAVAGPDREKVRDYVGHTGVIGSYLESAIQEQVFHNWQGTGLSTMQVFLDANAQRIPIHTLTAANASALLARLQVPADALADIQTALAAGFEVVVPERIPVKAVGVNGIGYQTRDPATGSASYRIWGGTHGGDGETPCAERQRVPLVQAVREIVATTLVIAAMAAAIAYTGGMAGAAGAQGALVLKELMAAMGLAFLTFPATAGNLCTPIPLGYHSGGDDFHDACADFSLPNDYPGNDICMSDGTNSKRFDAISGKILWEAKTDNLDNWEPAKRSNFARIAILGEWVATATDESKIARACGYQYKFVIGEPELADEARIRLSSLVDEMKVDPPQCLQSWTGKYPKR